MKTDVESLELEDGKYTVLHRDGGITVLRYGEVWRNETGDKLILAMFQEIQESHKEIKMLKEDLKMGREIAKEQVESAYGQGRLDEMN